MRETTHTLGRLTPILVCLLLAGCGSGNGLSTVKGTVTLTPWPFGKKSVSFPLKRYDAATRTAVFENLAHDFPQTFAYRLAAANRLQIRLTGEMRGATRSFTIDLTRRGVSEAGRAAGVPR